MFSGLLDLNQDAVMLTMHQLNIIESIDIAKRRLELPFW